MTKRNSRTSRARAYRALMKPQRYETTTRVRAPDGLDLGLKWFLVYTSPRGEEKAAAALYEAGCRLFVPQIHRVVVSNERRVEIRTATFPRYLFASGKLLEGEKPDRPLIINGRPIQGVLDIETVQAVVGNTRGWVQVPAAAIQAVMTWQNAAPVGPPPPPYLAGDRVQIIDGPFMSFTATVVDVIGLREAEVLISIFGRETRSKLDLADIRAA